MKPLSDIVDKTGIILTKDALKKGYTKHALYSFLRENHYEQVSHGIYVAPETWEDELYILALICPQGVLSHEEALYHYGLTDREPLQHSITIYTGYGTSRLVEAGFKVFTVKKELLEVGKTQITTSFGHIVPMYDLERTICDLVRSRSSFEIQDFQTALKTYAKMKERNLNKLMEYAKLFHVEKKIREYMEVLL